MPLLMSVKDLPLENVEQRYPQLLALVHNTTVAIVANIQLSKM